MPLSGQLVVRQNLLDDTASRRGTHGELATDQMAQVGNDSVAELLLGVAEDIVEGAHTLAVETEVLGETLRHTHLQVRLLVEEVPHGPGVILERARGETLVR